MTTAPVLADRRHLWAAIQTYAERDRRYGGAVDRATT